MITGGSNPGDNYVCVMKALSVVADVKGCDKGKRYEYMAKCIPMNQQMVEFCKEVKKQFVQQIEIHLL